MLLPVSLLHTHLPLLQPDESPPVEESQLPDMGPREHERITQEQLQRIREQFEKEAEAALFDEQE